MANKPNYVLYGSVLLTVITLFSAGLVAKKLINSCFYVLTLIAVFTLLFQRGAWSNFWCVAKQYWQLNLAMCGVLIAAR